MVPESGTNVAREAAKRKQITYQENFMALPITKNMLKFVDKENKIVGYRNAV